MIYYVDIDNTICKTSGGDYQNSIPYHERISIINSLYDNGNTVIYWTARGGNSGIDWKDFTISQLKTWGCKYTDIKFGKPSYDIFIEDKSIVPEEFFKCQEF